MNYSDEEAREAVGRVILALAGDLPTDKGWLRNVDIGSLIGPATLALAHLISTAPTAAHAESAIEDACHNLRALVAEMRTNPIFKYTSRADDLQ